MGEIETAPLDEPPHAKAPFDRGLDVTPIILEAHQHNSEYFSIL